MKQILSFFNRDAFYNTRPWVNIFCGSAIVFFLLATLQPFSIKASEGLYKYFVIISFTLVTTSSCAIVSYLFPLLFKKFYTPTNWTIGKDLANHTFIVLFIAFGNFAIDCAINHRVASGKLHTVLLFYICATLIIGVIPGTVLHFIVHNYVLKQKLTNIQKNRGNSKEHSRKKTISKDLESYNIVLSGNTKESLNLDPMTIIYVESIANYVKIGYLINNTVQEIQLRATLSKIEKDLQAYTYLLRCHRAYIINKSYVKQMKGNSQGLQLSLRHIDKEVPVSRSYTKIVRESL